MDFGDVPAWVAAVVALGSMAVAVVAAVSASRQVAAARTQAAAALRQADEARRAREAAEAGVEQARRRDVKVKVEQLAKAILDEHTVLSPDLRTELDAYRQQQGRPVSLRPRPSEPR